MTNTLTNNTPQHIAQLIKTFNAIYPAAAYTFAHIVLGDWNLAREGHIRWCLDDQYDDWHTWRRAEIAEEHKEGGYTKDGVDVPAWEVTAFDNMCKATRAFLELLYTFNQHDLDKASELLWSE